MTNDDNTAPDIGKDSRNRVYNSARADWHRHRAAIATDNSVKVLHEKFVVLYDARGDGGHVDLQSNDI